MIYTALTGGVDKERADIKCFSEYNKFNTPRMNAKIYKVLPHLFMPDEEWWIWHDANIFLKHPEQYYIDLAINNKADTLVIRHPHRDSPLEEIEEVKKHRLDNLPDREWDRLKLRYEKVNRLAMCGFIVRKNIETVRLSNEKWWAEICSGSVRDQLSFDFCFPNATFIPRMDTRNNHLFTRPKHIKPRVGG